MTNSMTIGLVAYQALPGLVFVRVPNERGRWMLTHQCVVEVACRLCGAIVGEPCKRLFPTGIRYHVDTHCIRRNAAHSRRGRNHQKPKLHVRADDISEAMAIVPEAAEMDPAPVVAYAAPFPLVLPRKDTLSVTEVGIALDLQDAEVWALYRTGDLRGGLTPQRVLAITTDSVRAYYTRLTNANQRT